MLAFDTNLVLYAFVPEAPEHGAARAFLLSLEPRDDVVISELVLVELYRLLRNPAVLRAPLTAGEASEVIDVYRRHPRWRLIGFAPESRVVHDRLWQWARKEHAAARSIYDARLAFTLLAQGVDELATANVKDFKGFGFRTVWNPLSR